MFVSLLEGFFSQRRNNKDMVGYSVICRVHPIDSNGSGTKLWLRCKIQTLSLTSCPLLLYFPWMETGNEQQPPVFKSNVLLIHPFTYFIPLRLLLSLTTSPNFLLSSVIIPATTRGHYNLFLFFYCFFTSCAAVVLLG